MRVSILFIISLFCLSSYAQQERKVLILGIDGCRHDALQAANTPNIDLLIDNATFTYEGLTQAPTWSGVGWSSMLTGVWGEKHGVSDNSFSGSNFSNYPHFFNHIKSVYPDKYLSSICHWSPINTEVVDLADNIQSTSSDQEVEDLAEIQLGLEELDAMFLHFDDVDHAGHANGFSINNPEYMDEIEQVDAHIGNVISALNARASLNQENWLIVVSTDHGGLGSSHGGGSYEERNIFIVFSGDDYANEELSVVYESTDSDPSGALNFNGSDDYGVLDNTGSLFDFGTSQDFTVELRIKTNGWTSDPSIISDKDWNSGNNDGFILACMTNQDSWKFNIGDGSNRIDLDGGSISDNEWHHIAVSVSRQNGIFTFQDGELVSSTSDSFTGNIDSGLPISIGQDGTLTYSAEFEGWIDEVRVWNEALSEETLADWACSNTISSHPNVNQLIGHWSMDAINLLQVFDNSSFGNHLSLINGPTLSTNETITCTSLLNAAPVIVDIAPTVLSHLCVDIDPAWELDGESYASNSGGCSGNCQGDLNGDNTIDVADLLSFLSVFGCQIDCELGDFDNDGVVSSNDLLLFLPLFGGACP